MTFPDCPDLSGKCLSIASTNYGTANWHTQLAYGTGPGVFTSVTLKKAGTYKLTYKGKVTSPDSGSRHFSVWQQNGGAWPPAINYTGTLATTGQGYDSGTLTLNPDAFSADTGTFSFVVPLGPDADNQGVTFFFDDVQLLEQQ